MNLKGRFKPKLMWPQAGLGTLAYLFYGIHGAYHVLVGHPENLLWACHVGALLVGTGLIWGSPAVNAIGFLWLMAGIPLWLVDVSTGGEFLPTSVAPHFGGLLIGAYGLKELGMPKNVWWKSLVGLLVLQQISRWVTPKEYNVNLAFGVWAGWEDVFPSYLSYMLLLFSVAAVVFLSTELVLSRLVPSEAGEREWRAK